MKNFQLTLGVLLLFATSFNAEVVSGASAVGRLACMDATTSSNLIYIEFSGAGTTGANLYRHGAPSFIASYPNRASGAGSHNDTGLSSGSSYRYELRSGTQVLANVTCSTKSAAPAPAPTTTEPEPTQSPTPSSPTPTPAPTNTTTAPPSQPASPTVSPSAPVASGPTISPIPLPRPTAPVFQIAPQVPVVPPTLATVPENQTVTPVEEVQPDVIAAISGTTLPPPRATTQAVVSNNSAIPTSYFIAVFLAAVAGLMLLRRTRRVEPVSEKVAISSDAVIMAAPPPVPPPIFLASVPAEMLKRDMPLHSPGTVHRPDNLVANQFGNRTSVGEPTMPMRTYTRRHASQLHRQLQPANPYSDRSRLR